jgi:23S rRNA (guanine745-N1)-methyltransferase
MTSIWKCPKCDEPLVRESGSFACKNGHSYDVSKDGYVNLLRPGRKASKIMGDSREMLEARRRFFDAGFYEPLREFLTKLAKRTASNRVILEAGCGEGYYAGGVAEALPGALCLGTDISKDAVRMAAKRYAKAQFAVADTNDELPLNTGSADLIFDIFAPRNAGEFRRLIKPGGRLVIVIPTERHLAELQDVRPLKIQADKRSAVEASMTAGFELESAGSLTFEMRLGGQSARDLVMMTPNGWFLDESDRGALAEGDARNVTAQFEILTFSPR